MRISALAAVFALGACSPAASTPATRAPGNVAAESDPEQELVCKDERMTGTNMTRTVCRTKAEIAEERRAAMEWEKHPRNDPPQ